LGLINIRNIIKKTKLNYFVKTEINS